ncbi:MULTISPECIES: fumarylacetoacetate hydrolase family protein [unclassified Microbacterium]|uniref:fumarylacetoacetate hydrolase family protein n=1 Tax=unclassified Microbacterium TaxID=2609290 RepID=UPI001782F845|nr:MULTISPECIES: fumarylacetoacetate hydrolase family protein [unclassified Microbacterium]MBD8207863.1 fumarylacetoacetate hydrolase family protein [Microbacterium sp. CFBP 8801]MBD8477176.1 fumarylacetoacetate hydrolase family protein [Microbacterium sp. CFBP 8794]MBD8511068.1 fumarylacetoacetate hydrolase family protein [Microbacterium sp. CFBP 8790]
MKYSHLRTDGGLVPAAFQGGRALDVRRFTPAITGAFLAEGPHADIARIIAADGLPELDHFLYADDARVAAPVARPGKIVCIGLNYRDHAEETGAAIPTEPVVFMKDPSTLGGPFDPVRIPRGSVKTDWEVELGVVIGRTTRYLDSPADARACIGGFVLSHDVSEREFQLERGGQWDKGKSCETFNPLGPWVATVDEIPDPQNLGLRLSVNGVERQNGSTSTMIFDVDHIVWALSQVMVLHPGDLINTGTPAGVALGLEGTPYLRAGDVVELSIDGLGQARQSMIGWDAA